MTTDTDLRALDAWLDEHLFPVQAARGLRMLPYYSASGDGMLAVLEAMRERGWTPVLGAYDHGWGCEVFTHGAYIERDPDRDYDQPAPLAVALAAKAALESEAA